MTHPPEAAGPPARSARPEATAPTAVATETLVSQGDSARNPDSGPAEDTPADGPRDRTLRRIGMRVEYDGTGLAGWQRQPGQATVQGHLEAALQALLGVELTVDGGSRTDAGVHARDQRAAVTLAHPIRLGGLTKALNARLPPFISVRDLRERPLDHQPRFDNGGKIYVYRLRVGLAPRPLTDRFAWRVPWALDLERLLASAADLVGRHDFTSFAARDGSHQSAVRTLYGIEATTEACGVLALRFAGDAFLKHMIRNLVGTLVEVARGHRAADSMPTLLRALDRRRAGPTAPPHGLELEATLPPRWLPPAKARPGLLRDWAHLAADLGAHGSEPTCD